MTTFTLDQSSYTAYSGDSITLTCSASITGGTLDTKDIIWQFYPVNSNTTVTVIYSNDCLKKNLNGKYIVNTFSLNTTSVTSTLIVRSLNITDTTYVYECVCNVYEACSSGNKAYANATFNILTTTTITTSSILKCMFSLLLIC